MKRMKLIYEPTGAAKEYGDLALNIFDGCPHGCTYCYVPLVGKKDRKTFHSDAKVRKDKFFELLSKDLNKIENQGKSIFLCFMCDPFPYKRHDLCQITLEVIDAIKTSGNNVTVLTKGEIDEDWFEYFDECDTLGTTISCDDYMAKKVEPKAFPPSQRLVQLSRVKKATNCKTFVSCEPVFEPKTIYRIIKDYNFIDEYRIGKLNYVKSDIDWKLFGINCEDACKLYGRNYMIKKGLREEMEK